MLRCWLLVARAATQYPHNAPRPPSPTQPQEATAFGISATFVVFFLLELTPLVVILRQNRQIAGKSLLPSPLGGTRRCLTRAGRCVVSALFCQCGGDSERTSRRAIAAHAPLLPRAASSSLRATPPEGAGGSLYTPSGAGRSGGMIPETGASDGGGGGDDMEYAAPVHDGGASYGSAAIGAALSGASGLGRTPSNVEMVHRDSRASSISVGTGSIAGGSGGGGSGGGVTSETAVLPAIVAESSVTSVA